LNFLAEATLKPVNYAYEPPAGVPSRSGKYVQQSVAIRDGRELLSKFSLETNGFVLTEHELRSKSWRLGKQLRRIVTMADLRDYTQLRLTPDLQSKINNALVEGHPLVLAVADATGQPLLSFRGSLQTYSDRQLGFWLRNFQGNTIESIRNNPKVALIYRS
jgi:hypothetical protein